VTTRLLPARPIGRGVPVFTSVDSKLLEPGVRDFRVHDMNVTIRLNLFGWQLATFNIDLDMGKLSDDVPTRSAIDGACKRLSRRAAEVDRPLGCCRAEPRIRGRILGRVSHRFVPSLLSRACRVESSDR
jgi:hypothetical protein